METCDKLWLTHNISKERAETEINSIDENKNIGENIKNNIVYIWFCISSNISVL